MGRDTDHFDPRETKPMLPGSVSEAGWRGGEGRDGFGEVNRIGVREEREC